MAVRLSPQSLHRAPADVGVPCYDRDDLSSGIVHLGLGAFHRGHQALVTEDAMIASGDLSWGIVGVSPRNRDVAEQLRPQGGLFTTLEKSPGHASARVIGSIRDVRSAIDEPDAVGAAIAAPSTRIVSLTITEKGYHTDSSGRLIVGADIDADIAALTDEVRGCRHAAAPRTALGILARGLLARARVDAPRIAVMSCDNMVSNGTTLERLVRELLDLVRDPCASQAADGVDFVSTVVDRMVPTTGEAGRAQVQEILGLRDEGAVLAEPYWQWVMQDRFPAGRPAWDAVGAVMADDVEPFEHLKLRLLNASHSLLAYLGSLAGFTTIAQAVSVPEFEAAAWTLIADEAAPALALPPGVDALDYGRSVMERYQNSALGHQTAQVAMDGSQKLPLRLVPTAEATLARGGTPWAAALTYAAWMVFIARGRSVDGRPLVLDDPRAHELRAAASGDPAGLVERFLLVPGLFSETLAEDDRWVELLEESVARLRSANPADWVGAA